MNDLSRTPYRKLGGESPDEPPPGKIRCPECKGWGWFAYIDRRGEKDHDTCPYCKGKGWIDPPKEGGA